MTMLSTTLTHQETVVGQPFLGARERIKPTLAIALALIFSTFLFVPWLGMRDFWFPDEPDVAEPAMTMYRTGNWITPKHNDEAWADYPPLTYWLGAASAHVFGGPSPFVLRFPVAVMAVLLLAMLAFLPPKQPDGFSSANLWAVVALGTTPLFVFQSINYHPDMAFALFQTAGLLLYGVSFSMEPFRQRPWCYLLRCGAFACFGLAVLSKGPLGLLLPGLILAIWLASIGNWKSMLAIAGYSVISLAICLPWYFAFAKATGAKHVWTELYLQNFARFTAASRGHGQPWYYYSTGIWPQMAPWALLLPSALWSAARNSWKDPITRLVLLWFGITFLFLSVAATKRQVYLLPAYPAAAILIGRYLHTLITSPPLRVFQVGRIVLGVVTISASFPLIASALFPGLLDYAHLPARAHSVISDLRSSLLISGIGTFLLGAFLLKDARQAYTARIPLSTAGYLALIFLTLQIAVFPRLDQERSYRPAMDYVRSVSPRGRILYFLPGAEIKRCGFRVVDPLFKVLPSFDDPQRLAMELKTPGAVAIAKTDQVGRITPFLDSPQQGSLKFKEFHLSSKSFTIIHNNSMVPR